MGFFKKNIHQVLDEVAGVLYCLAAADGDVAEEEVLMASNYLANLSEGRFGLEEAGEKMVAAAEVVKRVGVDKYLEQIAKKLDAEGRELLLYMASRIIVVDGQLPDRERDFYQRLAWLLKIDTATADRWVTDAMRERDELFASHQSSELVRERLFGRGWVDPFEELRASGASVSGFGDAFQLENQAYHLLRLEHHPQHKTIEFHVTDDSDSGFDYAFEYGDKLEATLNAIFEIQNELTLVNVHQELKKILAVCPNVFFTSGGEPKRITA